MFPPTRPARHRPGVHPPESSQRSPSAPDPAPQPLQTATLYRGRSQPPSRTSTPVRSNLLGGLPIRGNLVRKPQAALPGDFLQMLAPFGANPRRGNGRSAQSERSADRDPSPGRSNSPRENAVFGGTAHSYEGGAWLGQGQVLPWRRPARPGRPVGWLSRLHGSTVISEASSRDLAFGSRGHGTN